MTGETFLFFLVLTVGVSVLIMRTIKEWMQEMFLRAIGYSIFTDSAFMLALVIKHWYYDGEPFTTSAFKVAAGLRDGDEMQILLTMIAIGVGFIASLRRIR